MAENLDPKLLAQLLGLMQSSPADYNELSNSYTWQGPDGYSVTRAPGEGTWTGGDAGYWTPGDMRTRIGGNFNNKLFGVESNDVWDEKGNYLGKSTGDSDLLSLAKAAALAAAGYYGAGALTGAETAAATAPSTTIAGGSGLSATGGGGYGSMMGGSGLGGTGAGLSITPGMQAAFTTPQLAAMGAAGGAAGALGATGGASTPAGTGVTGAAKTALDAGAKTSSAAGLLDSLKGAGGVAAGLGALAGAADGGDKTQSSARDPWAPAQPFLRGLLDQGQGLSAQYRAQPFSPAQQTAYGNIGGLLDSINAASPGLLNNMGQVQQFVRGGKPTTRGVGMNLQWAPGLLGSFGTRG